MQRNMCHAYSDLQQTQSFVATLWLRTTIMLTSSHLLQSALLGPSTGALLGPSTGIITTDVTR